MTDERLPERPELRASHADRDRIAEQLRIAAGDGRLTMDELDERLDKALNARTGSELEVLVRDLPAGAGAGLELPAEAKDRVTIEVSSGSARREGRWVVPKAMSLRASSGSIKLDLTEAVITTPVLRVDVEVKSGSVLFVTRPGIEVVVEEVSVRSGSTRVRTPKQQPSVPTVLRIEVSGSVGSGSVSARPPVRGFVDWLRRRPVRYPDPS